MRELKGAVRDLFSTDYRTVKAVDGISFDIEPGEIVGYIGPNGAGKSTTIKMMTGILKPTGRQAAGQRACPVREPHPPGDDHGRGLRPAHPAVVGPAGDRIIQDSQRGVQDRPKSIRRAPGNVQRPGRLESALPAAGAHALPRAAHAVRYHRLVFTQPAGGLFGRTHHRAGYFHQGQRSAR